jgi:hypothetical protein
MDFQIIIERITVWKGADWGFDVSVFWNSIHKMDT